MPLPKPKLGEKQSDFMSRCVVDPDAMEEFPREGQRIAVCYNIWRDRKYD
jgi:hypothetical protein